MQMKEKCFGKEEGFIVQSLFFIFYYLERLSVFFLLRLWARRRFEKSKESHSTSEKPFVMTYIFPELWVVGNLIFARISHYLVNHVKWNWLIYILIAYAIERTIEMFVYQVNVLFFHRLNPMFIENINKQQQDNKLAVTDEYAIKSSTRTVWLLILNMIEYVFQFAVIFAALCSLQQEYSVQIGLFESFRLFMNLGGLENCPSGIIMTIAYVETIIGIFMNILCLARFVGALPEVREKGYLVERTNVDEQRKAN